VFVDTDVISCETVINPLEMFPHMTAAAAAAENDDDDMKFIFTIRFTRAARLVENLEHKYSGV